MHVWQHESLFDDQLRIDLWPKAIALREKKLAAIRERKVTTGIFDAMDVSSFRRVAALQEYEGQSTVTANMQLLADMEAMRQIVKYASVHACAAERAAIVVV